MRKFAWPIYLELEKAKFKFQIQIKSYILKFYPINLGDEIVTCGVEIIDRRQPNIMHTSFGESTYKDFKNEMDCLLNS